MFSLIACKLVCFGGLQTCVSYLVWSKHKLLDGNHVEVFFRMLQWHAWHCEGSISLFSIVSLQICISLLQLVGFNDENCGTSNLCYYNLSINALSSIVMV